MGIDEEEKGIPADRVDLPGQSGPEGLGEERGDRIANEEPAAEIVGDKEEGEGRVDVNNTA
eukprot:6504160-Lingulodinium_polyedra.AAC.1